MPAMRRDKTPADGRPQIQALVTGAAVILLVAGAVWITHRNALVAKRVQGVPGGHAEFALHPAMVGGNTVTLSWSPFPGATAYVVELQDASMARLGTRQVRDTVCVLQRVSDLQGAAPGSEVSWRVMARRGGITVSESATERFLVP